MRSKALTIAAAVAGYLAIEAALIWYSELAAMPEMVVLVSTLGMLAGFIWGGRPSAKQALRIVGGVIASPIAAIVFALAATLVAYPCFVMADSVARAALPVACVGTMVTLSVPTLFFLATRRFRYGGLEAAADQWLSDRARYGSVGMRRRSRIRRWSLWLPTLTVLLILYFWAPLQGALSYPLKWRAGHLAGGNVRVPISWAGYQQELEEHHRYLVLLKVDDILPATLQFGRKQVSYSYISVLFESKSDPEHNSQKAVEQFIRDAHLYEWDLRPRKLPPRFPNMVCWEATPRCRHCPDGYLLATCASDDGRFLAEFNGYRTDLDSFYEIVSSVEVRK